MMWYEVLFIALVLSCSHHTHAQDGPQCCDVDNSTCSKGDSYSQSSDSKPIPRRNNVDDDNLNNERKQEKMNNRRKNDSDRNDKQDGFDIYRNKIEATRKLKEGRKTVEHTLRASSTERCDWMVSPLKYLKGEYCGKHYKIFGLNRHMNDSSKEIKKRFRKLSLLIHPDKNPAENAPRAFSALSEGYDCLMSSDCKAMYDEQLGNLETQEMIKRETQLRHVTAYLRQTFESIFYYVSWTATSIERVRANIWANFEHFEIMDVPVGKIGMLVALYMFRNPLLYIIGFSRGTIALLAYLAEQNVKRRGYNWDFDQSFI